MTRWATFIAQFAIFALAFYGWRVEHIEGCENLIRFFVTIAFFLSTIVLIVVKPGDIQKPRAGAVLRGLRQCADVAVIVAFVWVGAWVLALGWCASCFFARCADSIGRLPKQTQTVGAGSIGIQAGGNVTLSSHTHSEPYPVTEA